MVHQDRVSILLVDDLPEKLFVLETVLEELGENVVIARSGAEALQKVLLQDFAVILMDVEMPGIDGIETASLIRKRRRSARTPIIFVTAYADDLRTTQGYSLGAVESERVSPKSVEGGEESGEQRREKEEPTPVVGGEEDGVL